MTYKLFLIGLNNSCILIGQKNIGTNSKALSDHTNCILFKYLKVGLYIIVLCIKGPWIGVCNNRLNRNVRVCVNCDPSEFLPTHPLPPIYILPLFPK